MTNNKKKLLPSTPKKTKNYISIKNLNYYLVSDFHITSTLQTSDLYTLD